jgi:isoleucyl-tRNA synthetase
MSKSLRNYPDPMEVLNLHGADALRLYLIDSPVVKAQELRFSETGVKDITRRILLRWWNSYSFFVSYANIDGFKPRGDAHKSPNILDQWVLSRLHALIANTENEMAAYRLYNVVPALLSFIEDLTNTYIRFNRSHFWQDGMPEDKRYAYETLYEVLLTLSKVMAPFAPFLAETTYQNLSKVAPQGSKESVHLESFPVANTGLIRKDLEEAVRVMDQLVMLGRNQREKISVKAKIPLKKMRVIQREARILETLKKFEPYFKEELNIQAVEYDSHEDQFVQITAKANFPVLGKRVGPKMKAVAAGIQKLGLSDLLKLEAGETLTVEGEAITISDLEIRRSPKAGHEALAVSQIVSIELDPTVTEEQKLEGLSREVLRKVQQARKNAKLNLNDRIVLELSLTGELLAAAQAHQKTIASEALATSVSFVSAPKGSHTESVEIEEGVIGIGLAKS